MSQPKVTIVVVPRERFSFTRESLESLYENTKYPFELIYVDNKAPDKVRTYLETQAKEKGFQLVSSDRFLSPNAARNLGLRQVSQESKYVIFLDNDVVLSPGWLKPLVECAEETGATVVGPLVCQHEPLHTIIHCAGGEYMSAEDMARFFSKESQDEQFKKPRIKEKIYLQDKRIADVSDRLQRQTTGFIEFHCILVRTEFFDKEGLLDEGLCCTKEYLDLAMTVVKSGGNLYLEPASIVTFRTHFPAPPLEPSDIPYYMIRWSDAWERASLLHFANKWDLADDPYFKERLRVLGWRRRIEIIQPIANHFQFLGKNATLWIRRIIFGFEKIFNFGLTTLYTLRHSQYMQKFFRREVA